MELRDSSANKLNLKLQGAAINRQGLFGPCLESFRGNRRIKHAAVAPKSAVLSPKGPIYGGVVDETQSGVGRLWGSILVG